MGWIGISQLVTDFSVMKKMPWVHCVDCFEIDGKCVWLISTVGHSLHCDHLPQ